MLRLKIRLFKGIHKEPFVVLLASALMSVIFRFHLSYLSFIGFVLAGYVVWLSVRKPWLLLLALIPSFFLIEPVPKVLGFGEVVISSMLVIFIAATFYHELKNKNHDHILYIVIASLLFIALIALSFFKALHQNILFDSWFRSIAPFLMWYLMLPIFFTLYENFIYKLKWILVACAVLSLLVSLSVNVLFFYHGLFKPYWFDQNNIKLYNLVNVDKFDLIYGPYWERITSLFSQATSEILPVSLVVFSLISIFEDRKFNKFSLIAVSAVAFLAVLETYTRSMLIASSLIIFFLCIALCFIDFKLAKRYIKTVLVLCLIGVSFIYSLNLNSVWLGRLGNLTQIFWSLKSGKSQGEVAQKTYHDENIKSRREEYDIGYHIFRKNPLWGGGLGIKHDMSFQVSGDYYLHQSVGYIHNWFFYWLMVGGLIGLFVYLSVSLLPIIVALKCKNTSLKIRLAIVSTMCTMLVYASFFAVFRLFTFNFLLSLLCGISFSLMRNRKHISFVTGNWSVSEAF